MQLTIMRSLLSRLLYGGSKRLRPYEVACFNALLEKLPSEAARILQEQLQAVDVVQRHSKDKLVTVYFSKSISLLPNREPELRVARILVAPQAGEAVRADIVFHQGRLSSLEFRSPPNRLAKGPFSIQSVQVDEEVLREPVAPQPLVDESKMPTLARIKQSVPVADVLPPASDSEVSRFLADVAASPPSDYVALLRETNGFKVDTWRFLGTKARQIVLPDRTLVLAAEGSEKALCFDVGSRHGLLLYDQIDDESTPGGDHFIEALVAVVARDQAESTP